MARSSWLPLVSSPHLIPYGLINGGNFEFEASVPQLLKLKLDSTLN
jgi:hypothetical protein